MSEKQAAVEAKQEGEFTLKGKTKPKKPKQLGNKEQEVTKVNLKEPLVEVETNVTKVEIKKEGDVYNGTVVKSDVEKAIGKVVLRDFKKDGDEWKGKFYAVKRDRMVDATLKPTGEDAMEMVVSAGPRTKTVPMTRAE